MIQNEDKSQDIVREKCLGKCKRKFDDICDNICNKIVDVLNCPVCFELIIPPIIGQCRNGHIFCTMCTKKISTCPTCRCTMTNTRALVLEQLAEHVEVSCPNSCDGCHERVRYCDIKKHLRECKFKKIACCPFNNCQHSIQLHNIDDMKTHFINVHGIHEAKDRIIDQKSYGSMLYIRNRKTSDDMRYVILFRHKGLYFLEETVQTSEEIRVKIKGIGTQNDFKYFYALFSIKRNNGIMCKFHEPIKSIEEISQDTRINDDNACFNFKISDIVDNFQKKYIKINGNKLSGVRFSISMLMCSKSKVPCNGKMDDNSMEN